MDQLRASGARPRLRSLSLMNGIDAIGLADDVKRLTLRRRASRSIGRSDDRVPSTQRLLGMHGTTLPV